MGDFEGSGGGMVWGILRVAEVVWCGGCGGSGGGMVWGLWG